MNDELTARHIAVEYFRVWGFKPDYAMIENFVDDYWPKSYIDHGITYQEVYDAVLDVLSEEIAKLR